MIVKIKFAEDITMLFGDSYKKWDEQLREYCNQFKMIDFRDIWYSPAPWISFGGLKRCHEKDFAKIAKEREGRDASKIMFTEKIPANILKMATKIICEERYFYRASKNYRKKPVIIDALEWRPGLFRLLQGEISIKRLHDGTYMIPTLEGDHILSDGDMIIKGIKGEFYACKKDIFEASYETIPFEARDVS